MEPILSFKESENVPCTWYGRNLIKHHWHDTVDGYQRCANCKQVRVPETINVAEPMSLSEIRKRYGKSWGFGKEQVEKI